jgi:hypothetical protein
MSTSSSSLPSTRHTVMGGASHLCSSHAFRQRRVHIHGAGAPSAARCTPIGAAPRADGQLPDIGPHGGNQPPSRWGGQVPPLSATTRGIETSRVATSRETLTCMTQWVRAKLHMHLSPLAPHEFWGGGGAWRWPHTCIWWSGRPCSGPTCQRSTIGQSTPPISCRSTPPPSSRQAGMRLSWSTTSL